MIDTRRLGVLAASLALAACSLEPAYHRPGSAIPAAWPQGSAYRKAPGSNAPGQPPVADIGWRDFFTDPKLQELIGIALKNNRNLRVAALDIEKAQAQYRIQRSDLFPTINASASDTIQRYPSGVRQSGATGSVGGVGTGNVSRYYSVGIGFTSYEIDLFGRIRSLDHAALEQYFSQVETRRSAQISLVAEVANAYLTLLADRALLKLAQNTFASQQRSVNLTRKLFQYGVDTQLDVSQAAQAADTADADIAQFTRQVAQDKNALQLLLGAPLPAGLSATSGLDSEHLLENLPAGLPSDLLTRRPDVLAAEHTLMAANANIGAARAAFFPSISLTGSFGTASSQLDGLFGDGSQAWTFAPTINLPIFAAGANVANLDLAKVEKNIEIAQYQQTIQTAFREVADGLAARGTLDQQLAAQQRSVDDARTSYKLSQMRFRQGVDNYLTVLDSQRSYYSARQNLIGVKLSRLQNLVTLYKALGGGWDANTVKSLRDGHQVDVASSSDHNKLTPTSDMAHTRFQNRTGDTKQ